MLKDLLFFSPTFLISYLLVSKFLKNTSLISSILIYINKKTKTSILALLILISILLITLHLKDSFITNTILNKLVTGFTIGFMASLISLLKPNEAY